MDAGYPHPASIMLVIMADQMALSVGDPIMSAVRSGPTWSLPAMDIDKSGLPSVPPRLTGLALVLMVPQLATRLPSVAH